MLKTDRAAPGSGNFVKTYEAGKVYEIAEASIVDAFFQNGSCEIVEERKPRAAPRNHARKAAPENRRK